MNYAGIADEIAAVTGQAPGDFELEQKRAHFGSRALHRADEIVDVDGCRTEQRDEARAPVLGGLPAPLLLRGAGAGAGGPSSSALHSSGAELAGGVSSPKRSSSSHNLSRLPAGSLSACFAN